MKITTKQLVAAILCIIIAFIPTYIAITYYTLKNSDTSHLGYEISIADQRGQTVQIADDEWDEAIKSIIKINSKLYAAGSLDEASLSPQYYDITLTDTNGNVTLFRYYFSTEKDSKTIVRDQNGKFHYLDFQDAKDFLSLKCAYAFYTNSSLPVLSIFGGNDVLPTEAQWKYKAVTNETVISNTKTVSSGIVYAMNSSTKLSFNIEPDKCTIKVFQDENLITTCTRLDEIPYAKLDSSTLSFEIYAEWTGSDEYSGYAKYKFVSTVGLAPEFFINTKTIQSGEFFLLYAKNISAPQKIEFSSEPSINFSPVFFEENGIVYALVPIDKSLEAPKSYVFTLSYGEKISQIEVKVEQRAVYDREYDCSSLSVSRDSEAVAEYQKLLSEIGSKYEDTRYFSDRFIDYETDLADDIAKILLGYGHIRTPNNDDDPFRLDGVDYNMVSGADVTAIASGKVVYIGESKLLGKFIVIDHGLGLKTWYCSLSETNVTLGSTVAKGDSIAKPGTTGYKNSNGVYLITTVMDVPVSPYGLQEDGLNLPK